MKEMTTSPALTTRREFLQHCGSAAVLVVPFREKDKRDKENMDIIKTDYDVIVIGGSFSGLSASMALGRSLRRVLVIDAGKPANRFTPHSHNFITHDGSVPEDIAKIARQQVQKYNTVSFATGMVDTLEKSGHKFLVTLTTGEQYSSWKVILATGIIDVLPDIPGFSACWGKSALHCPYCHGYEVRDTKTGILGNGDYAFEFGAMISNWTHDLTIYTNGPSNLTADQTNKLTVRNVRIVEEKIEKLIHQGGQLQRIIFQGGHDAGIDTIYARPSFIQHSDVAKQIGCDMTEDGYIKVDSFQRTTVPGVFACGDNASKMRTVANAVAAGTTAGMMLNKELILENF